jgi:hypothetical protein
MPVPLHASSRNLALDNGPKLGPPRRLHCCRSPADIERRKRGRNRSSDGKLNPSWDLRKVSKVLQPLEEKDYQDRLRSQKSPSRTQPGWP